MGVDKGYAGPPAWTGVVFESRPLRQCPIGKSLELLGAKWTLTLLRDALILGYDRFGQFEASQPGITPRVLSRRLGELQESGLLVKVGKGRQTRYKPTEKALAVRPILDALAEYGVRFEAGDVFWDGKPRSLEVYQQMMDPVPA